MMDATWFKRTLYGIAFKIGTRYNDCKLSKKPISLPLKIGYWLSYFAIFWKLKERLGFDRVRIGFSGAAPISHEVLKFFQSIGIPIREGYGLTETTGITHISDATNFKLGTVGKCLPGSEVKIAEDGEILIQHGGIFQGYFKDEEHTREAIVRMVGSWRRGRSRRRGYLKITDRKKDSMTAGGKNVARSISRTCSSSHPTSTTPWSSATGGSISPPSSRRRGERGEVGTGPQGQYTTFASLTKTEEEPAHLRGGGQGQQAARPGGEHP